MSDRIAVMEHGKVLQIADPKTLYEAPSSRAVASFIGTMNLFEGRVAAMAGDAFSVETPALGRLEASRPAGASPGAGSSVLVAIRPESLSLSRTPKAGPSRPCRLISTAYFGDRSQFQVGLEGAATPVAVAAANASAADGGPFTAGETLYLAWRSDGIVLLPPD